jgi:hypothetical protein
MTGLNNRAAFLSTHVKLAQFAGQVSLHPLKSGVVNFVASDQLMPRVGLLHDRCF